MTRKRIIVIQVAVLGLTALTVFSFCDSIFSWRPAYEPSGPQSLAETEAELLYRNDAPHLHLRRANFLLKEGREEEAVRAFRVAVAMNGGYRDQFIDFLLRLDRRSEAAEQVLGLEDPAQVEVSNQYTCAEALIAEGKMKEAITILSRGPGQGRTMREMKVDLAIFEFQKNESGKITVQSRINKKLAFYEKTLEDYLQKLKSRGGSILGQ